MCALIVISHNSPPTPTPELAQVTKRANISSQEVYLALILLMSTRTGKGGEQGVVFPIFFLTG